MIIRERDDRAEIVVQRQTFTSLIFEKYSIKLCVSRIAKRPGEIFGLERNAT